jgi:glycosyltransferase involved in cell wall biosynthesis
LKVLIVTPHIFAGGAEKAILNLAYHLNAMGCDTSITTLSLDLAKLPPQYGKLDFILPKKQIEPPMLSDIGKVFSSSLKEIFSFVRLLRKSSRTVDLICSCNFPTYWATSFARTGKPVVWLSSEVLGPVNQTRDIYERSLFFRFALGFASMIDKRIVICNPEPIVTCSKLNGRLIKERYGRDTLVLQTGVDYDFFNSKPSENRVQLGLGDGPVLLHVGALVQRKNQILSIHALKALKPRLAQAKLVLVGEGPWKVALQKEAKRLGLEKDVIFEGSVSEDRLRSLYYACTINLFPVKDQTWGLVPFEALVAGKPSIVAKGAGAAEVMGKENVAYLISPNVEELANAVLLALKHPEVGEDMVRRGQAYVRENLTWQKYARDMFAVFRRVLISKRNTHLGKNPKS